MRELTFPRLGERCIVDTLPNGLTVYVLPKPGFSKCYAMLAVHYGGNDERYAVNGRWRQTPAGVAHFLEHKMFEMPEENALQTLTARGASANAFTGADMTAYHFTCTEQFYENLATLLQFVTTPYFTQESVDKEQSIITQEIRMTEDDPGWQCHHQLMQGLYAHHPCRNSVAGSVESIAQITPEVLTTCHKMFYDAANMVLCVAGNVDARKVLQLAASIVPPSERKMLERGRGEPEEMESACQELERTMEVSAPTFHLGFKAEPDGSLRRQLVGDLAIQMLVGDSSPLYEKLYGEGLIDNRSWVSFHTDAETACFAVGGESRDPTRVAEEILSEAVRVAWNGLDEDLFRRVSRAMYGVRVQALDSFSHLCQMQARGHFAGYQYLTFPEISQEITKQEVEELLRESITGVRSCLSVIRPKGV